MRPSPLFLVLAVILLLLAVLAAVWPVLSTGVLVAAGVLLLVALLQAWWLSQQLIPEVSRSTASSWPLGVWCEVELSIHNPGKQNLQVQVYDLHPTAVEQEGLPVNLLLAPKAAVNLRYRLRATRRGDLHFGQVQMLLGHELCLWQRKVAAGEPETVQVYPNFAAVSHYAVMGADDQVRSMGIRQHRRRGTGMEFHQLREYRDGDLLRQVDWKASSRRRQLVSREYQEERDQQVVCLIDCGRRMHSKDEGLSHFDHALNAVLLLSYVALRQGDSVGFLTFSGSDRVLPPVKGPAGLTTILNQLYDLHSTTAPSDFEEAATRAMARLPRRSLVVWITNLRDEDADEILPAVQLLRRRHLVLVASLREESVAQVLQQEVQSLQQSLRHCMAHQYTVERLRGLRGLRQRGVKVLDVRPSELPASLVDRYWDIKASGLL